MADSVAEVLSAQDAKNDKLAEIVDNQEHLIAEMSSAVQSILFPAQSQDPSGPSGQLALLARAPLNPPPGPVPDCPPIISHPPPEMNRVSMSYLKAIVVQNNSTFRRIRRELRRPKVPGCSPLWRPGSPWTNRGAPVLYLNPHAGVPNTCGSRKYELRTWPDPLPRRYRPSVKPVAGPSAPADFSHGPRVLQSLEKPLMSRPEEECSWYYKLFNLLYVSRNEKGEVSTWFPVVCHALILTLLLMLQLAYSSKVNSAWNCLPSTKFCHQKAFDLGQLGVFGGDLNEQDRWFDRCKLAQQGFVAGPRSYMFCLFVLLPLLIFALRSFVACMLASFKSKQGLGMVLVSKRCVHYDSGLDKRHMVHQNVDIKRKGDLWEVDLDFFSYNVQLPQVTRRSVTIAPSLLEELLSSKFDKWGDRQELVDERFKDVHKILGVFNIPADRYDVDVVRDTLFVARNVLSIRRAHADYLGLKMPLGF